jgi:hypothetical protein
VRIIGQGIVVENVRVRDSLGKFHGLLRLVVERDDGIPDVDIWMQMLPANAELRLTRLDDLRKGRVIIYYKLQEHR